MPLLATTLPTDRLLLVVGLYGALLLLFRLLGRGPGSDERTTRFFIGLGWAVGTFLGNIGLAKIGLMSPLPLENNLLHTFVWIGFCLSWLYLAVRFSRPFLVQCALFAGASLIVKVAEHLLLGTWDLDHFLHLFPGNASYILGWSLMDGLYPPITLFALRLAGRLFPRMRLVIR